VGGAIRPGAEPTDPADREDWVLTTLLIVASVALFGTCVAATVGLFG
jgi:hypothetical protein